jgi:hypothetical protein
LASLGGEVTATIAALVGESALLFDSLVAAESDGGNLILVAERVSGGHEAHNAYGSEEHLFEHK